MFSIGIFCSQMSNDVATCIEKLVDSFRSSNATFFLHAPIHRLLASSSSLAGIIHPFESIEEIEKAKFVVSIGGDGTFLRAAHLVGKSKIPIIGINLGRMGFLTDIQSDEIGKFAQNIMLNAFYIEERPFIEVIAKSTILGGSENIALNEVCVDKKESSHLMTIHTWIDQEYLGSFWADGLIVASPTGSTAYSLSLGGPIVSPNSKNFLINFIAPHALTVRPLIIPDTSIIKLKVEGRDSLFNISLDSRIHSFEPQHDIIIKKSDSNLRIMKIEGKNYFTTLKNKLMWGLDIRN